MFRVYRFRVYQNVHIQSVFRVYLYDTICTHSEWVQSVCTYSEGIQSVHIFRVYVFRVYQNVHIQSVFRVHVHIQSVSRVYAHIQSVSRVYVHIQSVFIQSVPGCTYSDCIQRGYMYMRRG